MEIKVGVTYVGSFNKMAKVLRINEDRTLYIEYINRPYMPNATVTIRDFTNEFFYSTY